MSTFFGIFCRNLSVLAIMAAIVTVAAPVPAFAVEPVTVIRSSAPAIKRGRVLKEGTKIDLKKGESVEVLSKKGVRTVIKGPYNGPLRVTGKKVEQTRMEALRDAVLGKGKGTKVLGATRRTPSPGGAAQGQSDEIQGPAILIDIAQSGTWCAVKDVPLYLARSDFGRAVGILTDTETGDAAALRWPHFSQTILWPDAVPVRDGAAYAVKMDDADAVTLTLLNFAPSEEPAADLADMAEKGCATQVERIVSEISAED